MYATTRYNFVHLKAMHKMSPLEELVGGAIANELISHMTLFLISLACASIHYNLDYALLIFNAIH
jgi:hypothetical protein